MDEVVDERGDEDGLAGAGEAGHAEPDGRLDEVAGEVADIAEGIGGGPSDGRRSARFSVLQRLARAPIPRHEGGSHEMPINAAVQ